MEPAAAAAAATAAAARGGAGGRRGQRASAALLLALLLLVAACLLPGHVKAAGSSLGAWLAAHRVAGTGVYAGLFTALFMALVPTTPMELLAGYVFGFRWAFLLLLVLQPCAHSATFLTARKAGLLRVGGALREHLRLFQAIELAVKDDPLAAWQTVFLVCLSYLPAGPKVYGLAAMSSVRFHVLLVSSALACAPHSLVNAWLGSNLKDFSEIFSGGNGGGGGGAGVEERRMRLGMLALNVIGLIGCISVMAWYGKRALDKLSRSGGACGIGHSLLPTHGLGDEAVYTRAPL